MAGDYETHSAEYLEKQKEIIEERVSSENAGLLLDFVYDLETSISASTIRNYARGLRYIFEYAESDSEINPEFWDSNDWNKLLRRVARERDFSEGSKRNLAYASKKFIRWSIESNADPDEIDTPKLSRTKVDTENVLSVDEIVELIENAEHVRDKAILSLMYEGAIRRTALVQLDIQHYLTEPFPRIRMPQKEGVKTGSGRERPISWSQGYLDNWLTLHPRTDEPNAPLFVSIRSQDEGERLSGHSVYTMLKRVTDKTDIDSERVHPHAFRHARATEMRKSDQFDKSDIEVMMGWTESTPMHSRYTHATSTEEASRTAKKMGVDVGESSKSPVKKCPRCNTTLPPDSRYCPTCTLRIDENPPNWWNVFETVAKDTDPLKKQYDALPSTVPELYDLAPQELYHLRDILLMSEQLMNFGEQLDRDFDHPFDGVSPYSDEETLDEAQEIIEQIQEEMGIQYSEHPERFELANIEDKEEMEMLKEQIDE